MTSQDPLRELGFLIDELRGRVDTLPREQRIGIALCLAAELVEYAAYELARSEDSATVVRLMHHAAEIDRAATTYGASREVWPRGGFLGGCDRTTHRPEARLH